MSAKALLASARKTGGMPDEVTFRQEVMRGIAVNTFETCTICPELPRVFPSSTPDRNERGRTVFFVGAMDRWGLEVVVDGLDSQDYTSGFATGGRYAALEADDYAVLDLRGNANGTIPAAEGEGDHGVLQVGRLLQVPVRSWHERDAA
ncbi:hypothetical protein PHYSODRAFT_343226 [Phytophthora sojae]|uniref:Uncharacterized protein n=1 Tax=Phytophthora sojae (strain P6497) TaxID=1094619 RepID=G4YKN1_PHYSP|nr:hypothetical protein PHYSODRAFT_322488 [Phytophthora sojae]XP_009540066.1 hypothetical protein PHYSODRAFT_343226 [Phytophthora sojae]EGZ04477.1 hypothetical protein PHYSODRAFT_343226 [Phytophthora sojae]EGZ28863.1 hypothetical protein PHYSODRAFT_322488 [Phytophthora sojae]|eukprot:XP_009516138.1 hypothetical protein PHYSODRAFT_322488 [Phytophthora sojae]